MIDTAAGRDAMTALRSGVVSELSVGFDPIEFRTERRGHGRDAEEVRIITKAALWEASLVTWGANSKAVVTDVHRRGAAADPTEAVLDAEETKLRALELALAEDRHRDADLGVLAAGVDRIARECGLDPARPPRPDPTSVLGMAMAVREREQRDEALAGLMREGSEAIYRDSGRRRQ